MIGRVLIAGGGIAGLALATALRHRGLDAVVAEHTSAPARSGAGLVLAPNAMKALHSIEPGLAAAVRAAGRPSGVRGSTGHRTPFLDARGRELGRVSFDGFEERWGQPAVAILRADLHAVLLDAAKAAGAELVPGFTAQRYSGDSASIELVASDGRGLRGDVLVGADGLRSAVRRSLVGPGEPRYRGITAVRGTGVAPEAHPDGFIAYGRGIVVFAAGVGDGRVYWVASMAARRGEWPRRPAAEALRLVRDRLCTWDPAVRQVVATAGDAGCVVTDVFDRPPSRTWHRGRVALVGDAIHPMVYTLGQGAGMALEDAAVLGVRLSTAETWESALAGYAAERSARAAKVARQSRMLGRVAHVRSPSGAALRDAVLRIVTRTTGGGRQNAALFGWSPPC
ncbi:FAD-dependent monooxygenase [Amycolatopsis sp. NPDC021455]|uniref:FAD-dependent monooxygenase n=1 Tax=Amycolatopsis sp. NPDC021455 TaxID=3154901 RepID=UPI0033C42C9F